MGMIKIITDSSCDLSPEFIKDNEITVIPFSVNFDDKSYLDGVNIDVPTMYGIVDKVKKLPKTAAVAPAQFHEEFEKYSKDGEVIFLGLGSGFSATSGNATIVSKEFDNVYVIDSENLSTGLGMQVMEAVRLRKTGLNAKEIVEKVNAIKPLIRCQFAINTLDYLHMGGRCSSTSKFIGTLANLKPIIRVIDGKMEATKKPIGFTKALKAILAYLDNDMENVNDSVIFITHSMAEEDAMYLKIQLLKRGFPKKNIHITNAGATISTHCGPRTIGIIYRLK